MTIFWPLSELSKFFSSAFGDFSTLPNIFEGILTISTNYHITKALKNLVSSVLLEIESFTELKWKNYSAFCSLFFPGNQISLL